MISDHKILKIQDYTKFDVTAIVNSGQKIGALYAGHISIISTQGALDAFHTADSDTSGDIPAIALLKSISNDFISFMLKDPRPSAFDEFRETYKIDVYDNDYGFIHDKYTHKNKIYIAFNNVLIEEFKVDLNEYDGLVELNQDDKDILNSIIVDKSVNTVVYRADNYNDKNFKTMSIKKIKRPKLPPIHVSNTKINPNVFLDDSVVTSSIVKIFNIDTVYDESLTYKSKVVYVSLVDMISHKYLTMIDANTYESKIHLVGRFGSLLRTKYGDVFELYLYEEPIYTQLRVYAKDSKCLSMFYKIIASDSRVDTDFMYCSNVDNGIGLNQMSITKSYFHMLRTVRIIGEYDLKKLQIHRIVAMNAINNGIRVYKGINASIDMGMNMTESKLSQYGGNSTPVAEMYTVANTGQEHGESPFDIIRMA